MNNVSESVAYTRSSERLTSAVLSRLFSMNGLVCCMYINTYTYIHTYKQHAASLLIYVETREMSQEEQKWHLCDWSELEWLRKLKGGKAPESQPVLLRGTSVFMFLNPCSAMQETNCWCSLPQLCCHAWLQASFAAMIHCDTQHSTLTLKFSCLSYVVGNVSFA
jgi:hypothetical protein